MSKMWTLNELAQEAIRQGRPVTTGYLRRLCRQGARQSGIDANKIGRDWLVNDLEAQRWLTGWLDAEQHQGDTA